MINQIRNREEKKLFSIGCHSMNHSNLILNKNEKKECYKVRLENEIIKSKKLIEEKINSEIYSFALPSGMGDYNLLKKYFNNAGYHNIRNASLPGKINNFNDSMKVIEICYCDRFDFGYLYFKSCIIGIKRFQFFNFLFNIIKKIINFISVKKKFLIFDYITPPHLATPSRLIGEKYIINEINHIKKMKNIKRVMDIGCGSAEYRFLFTDSEYIGTDINDYYFADKKDKKVSFKVCDATDLDFFDEYVDFIFCIYAFEYFSNPAIALSEMFRVLQKDGYVLICLPQKFVKLYEGPLSLLRKLKIKNVPYVSGADNEYFYTPNEMKKMATNAGFKIEKILISCGYFVGFFKLFISWFRIFRRYIFILFFFVSLKILFFSKDKQKTILNRVKKNTELYMDRKVSIAKTFIELKEIQYNSIKTINFFDKLYIFIVKLLDKIDEIFSFKSPPEYIIILKK